MIGRAQDRLFVLDDEQRVAFVAQLSRITRMSRPMSLGCKPTLGSSITKSVFTSEGSRGRW